MVAPVTIPTKASVKQFITAVPNETRRKDAEALLKIFEKATGWKPQMWGPSIVGFGSYTYTYESGRSGVCCVCGFSPRSANLVLYGGPTDKTQRERLLKKLGKHKGASCVYVNKLADIDQAVLVEFIKAGVASMKATWPVTAK